MASSYKREMFKKDEEELQEYLKFKHRGFAKRSKKGKGSYDRSQRKEFDF